MMTNDGARLKLQEIQRSMQTLWNTVVEAADTGRAAHEVERDVFRGVLALGRQLLHVFFERVGDGDLGETVELPDGRAVRRLDRRTRTYQSVFGDFSLERWVYGTRRGQKIELVPTDQRLELPQSEFSYLLQDWAQALGVEHAWGQVAETLQRMLGPTEHVDSLERMSRHMAEAVPAFREQLPPPETAAEGEILVATVDNKGVPMRRPSDAPPPGARRQKGHKANKKRHATLGGVYSVAPKRRTPEDLLAALFRERPPSASAGDPQARQKRFRAALSDPDRGVHGQDETFRWLAQEVDRRRRGPDQPLVYLTDGQRSLQTDRAKYLDRPGVVEVLEFLHVVPRIWEAAYLFHPEGSRAAEAFVRPRLLRILQGQTAGVLKGLRRMGRTHRLPAARRTILETICRFLEQNLARMRYHEYLAAGFPIASGVIEGACRHVIKDRMERSGMRWTVAGAQALLDLRTTCINGHWHDFQTFRIEREHRRIYPHRQVLKHISWPLAT